MSFNPDYIAKYRESDVKDGHVDSNGLLNFENRGLPPVTGSGKALVSVDGEWTEQSGYPYEESGEVEVLADESVTTEKPAAYIPYAYGDFEEAFSLIQGKTYSVTIGTDTYHVIASFNILTGVTIGGSLTPQGSFDFSEYPFLIGYVEGEPLALVTETDGTYAVKIETVASAVHTIDPKYLPYGGTTIVNARITVYQDPETYPELEVDHTPREVYLAAAKGLVIFNLIVCDGDNDGEPLREIHGGQFFPAQTDGADIMVAGIGVGKELQADGFASVFYGGVNDECWIDMGGYFI